MKKIFLSLLVLVIATLITGCGSKNIVQENLETWISVTSPENNIKALFPVQPELTEDALKVSADLSLDRFVYRSEVLAKESYTLGFWQSHKTLAEVDTEKILKDMYIGVTSAFPETELLEVNYIKVGDFPAADFKFENKERQNKSGFRIILTDNYVYQIHYHALMEFFNEDNMSKFISNVVIYE